jgi:hypothetical protein
MRHSILHLTATNKKYTKDDFVHFWGHTSKGDGVTKACLCQWYPCTFTIDGQTYNCAEQYMMAEKARIFNDEPIRQQILRETDQSTIKTHGIGLRRRCVGG